VTNTTNEIDEKQTNKQNCRNVVYTVFYTARASCGANPVRKFQLLY